MMFGSAFLDELKLRADIVAIVGEYVALRKVGQSYKGLCPFHKEKTPSFQVRADPPVFHCFGCGAGGDVFEFMKLKEGLSFPDTVESLARRYGVALPETSEASDDDRLRRELEPVMQAALTHYEKFFWSEAGSLARTYLERRSFTHRTLEFIHAGAARDAWDDLVNILRISFPERVIEAAGLAIRGQKGLYDRFRNRAIFPIFSEGGKVVAFGARALNPEDEPKYLNSPETPLYQKSRTLYGLSWAKDAIRKSGRTVMMEGYLDVARAIEASVANAVAPCGTALTNSQVRLLKRLAPGVTLCFDGDAAGIKATKRAIEIGLEERMDVRVTTLPDGHDPDSFVKAFGAPAFKESLDTALPSIEWLALTTAREIDVSEPAGKASYMNALLPALSRMDSSVERAAWLPRIAQLGGIDLSAAKEEIDRALGSRQRVREGAITPQTATRAPRDSQRATKSEVWLIGLLLRNSAEAREAILELSGADLSSLKTERILTAVLGLLEASADVTLGALNERLGDEEDQRALREIAVQSVDVDPGAARSCVQSLHRIIIEKRLADIQATLKQTAPDGDLEVLLGEKVRLAQALAQMK